MAGETETLKIGDVVRLKSGGPAMTVMAIGRQGVTCQWFAGLDLQSGVIPETGLTTALSLPPLPSPPSGPQYHVGLYERAVAKDSI